jgi:hypothetical protein
MPNRDFDRIREILFKAELIEVDPDDDMYSGYVDFMDEVTAFDMYQLILMKDAGLIEGRDAGMGLFRVTNHGHDYLDSIRDNGIWTKTKTAVAETGGSATLEICKAISLGFVKQKLEKHTGIEL